MSTFDSISSRPGQLANVLAVWTSEATVGRGGGALPVVRLTLNETLLLIFCASMLRVMLHYVNGSTFRSYVRCPGTGCLLCRLGYQVEQRDLLPVYDPIERVVAVLPVGPNVRPAALRPQLMPVLRQVDQEGARPVLVGVRKPDNVTFAVSTHELPDGADDGAAVVKAFHEQLEAGQIDLASAYPLLSADDLAAMPEVKARMRLLGVQS
jgi:hypothetical protein